MSRGSGTTQINDSLANAAIGGTNLQQTALRGLPSYIGTYVQDGSAVSFSCPKATCKAKPFGQWSKVSVAGGQAQAAPFQIKITIAKSQLPSNLTLSKVVVYHTLDNNGGTDVIGDVAAERCVQRPDLDQHRPGVHRSLAGRVGQSRDRRLGYPQRRVPRRRLILAPGLTSAGHRRAAGRSGLADPQGREPLPDPPRGHGVHLRLVEGEHLGEGRLGLLGAADAVEHGGDRLQRVHPDEQVLA